jgi:dihydrofolate reductase
LADKEEAMSKVRFNITMTLDGYVAGPNQSLDDPLGEGGEDMHTWMYTLKTFREQSGQEGGRTGIDDDVLKEMFANVGAVIMGRNMFYGGGRGGPWKGDEWKGWWGDNPPYHMPVFVLTHHAREPQPMKGGTTFHFVTDGIETALQQAEEAAGEKDVLVMGGARNAQQYLTAGLIDEMDIHLSPVFLGAGERLFENIDVSGLKLEQIRSLAGSGVTHLRYRVTKSGAARSDGQRDQSQVNA